MSDIKKMNKNALEEYGREIGIELDKRLTKKKLIAQIEEHLSKNQSVIEEAEKVVKSYADTVVLRDKSTGKFYEGKKPEGRTSSGTYGGRQFWEV